MQLEQTEDLALVERIIRDPAVYPHVSDDDSPPAAEFRAHPELVYVAVRDYAGELLGCFVLMPHTRRLWEVHTCLLPIARGRGLAAARELLAWVWQHTDCERLITQVPDYNRLALKLAERAGLEQYGRNPRAWLRGGELVDLIQLGTNRPTDLGRPQEIRPCP